MECCRVCKSAVSSNHKHYGINFICHSCRAFFMRSVKSSSFKVFKHNASPGQCVIDSKTRQSCKKCRFEYCVNVGMKIKFVHKQAGSSLYKLFGFHVNSAIVCVGLRVQLHPQIFGQKKKNTNF